MAQKERVSRRRFLRAAGGAAAVPLIVPSSVLGLGGATPPSERITIGTIGQGGMGRGNTGGFMRYDDAQVLAVCDVDRNHLEEGARAVNERYKNEDCAKYTDYRELIGRDDIDAVCIATPDHWHAIPVIAAANAGKHIFCQKPMAHTFADGQAMVEAARRNNVIFQVGSQQRSQRNFRHAVELVLNGHIGKVKHVEVGLPTGHRQVPDDQDTREGEAPGHLDFDFWCGPSAKKPYMPARVHWNWRWQLEYGGGQLMDWIGHHNDIAHWGLGMDKSGPVEVQAKEFVYPEDRSVWNAAWKYEVWCQYENGVTTSISNINEQGCKWIGEDGWVFVSRGDFRASNPAWLERGYDAGPVKAYNSREHHRNFLDGIVEKKECICPAETGHRSITPGHLGLLSEALGGRVIRWDPKKEVVLDDEEADKLLKKVDYRSPWQLNGKA